MTPLLGKEGKVVIINILTFSSSLRRSTPDLSGGRWWAFTTDPVKNKKLKG
jgi:hypothetical protein